MKQFVKKYWSFGCTRFAGSAQEAFAGCIE